MYFYPPKKNNLPSEGDNRPFPLSPPRPQHELMLTLRQQKDPHDAYVGDRGSGKRRFRNCYVKSLHQNLHIIRLNFLFFIDNSVMKLILPLSDWKANPQHAYKKLLTFQLHHIMRF